LCWAFQAPLLVIRPPLAWFFFFSRFSFLTCLESLYPFSRITQRSYYVCCRGLSGIFGRLSSPFLRFSFSGPGNLYSRRPGVVPPAFFSRLIFPPPPQRIPIVNFFTETRSSVFFLFFPFSGLGGLHKVPPGCGPCFLFPLLPRRFRSFLFLVVRFHVRFRCRLAVLFPSHGVDSSPTFFPDLYGWPFLFWFSDSSVRGPSRVGTLISFFVAGPGAGYVGLAHLAPTSVSFFHRRQVVLGWVPRPWPLSVLPLCPIVCVRLFRWMEFWCPFSVHFLVPPFWLRLFSYLQIGSSTPGFPAWFSPSHFQVGSKLFSTQNTTASHVFREFPPCSFPLNFAAPVTSNLSDLFDFFSPSFERGCACAFSSNIAPRPSCGPFKHSVPLLVFVWKFKSRGFYAFVASPSGDHSQRFRCLLGLTRLAFRPPYLRWPPSFFWKQKSLLPVLPPASVFLRSVPADDGLSFFPDNPLGHQLVIGGLGSSLFCVYCPRFGPLLPHLPSFPGLCTTFCHPFPLF